MMATAQDVINVALGEVGTTEYPPNSNVVKYWDAYAPHWNGEPWCDRFVSWCGVQVGASDIVGVYDYTPYHAQFFRKRGALLDREEKPQPGDIVFFANKARRTDLEEICHIGIVVKRNGTVSVDTIEGNTSAGNNANGGAVQYRERGYGSIGSDWYIDYFGRPAYNTDAGTDGSGDVTVSLSNDDVQRVAIAVWEYMFGGDPSGDNCYNKLVKAVMNAELSANQLYSTNDPTGRGVQMTTHDHVKYIADVVQKILANTETIQAQNDKMLSVLDLIAQKIGAANG